MQSNNSKLQNIASQLANPHDAEGVEIGNMMNATNVEMNRASIKALKLDDQDVLLELGHGNAGHLDLIFTQATNLCYHGLEVSEVMHQEALRNNEQFIVSNNVKFELYGGKTIPFPNDSFTKIFTVNTLYFYDDPVTILNEIYRILCVDGLFILTFAQREFMETLPFTKFGFRLFDHGMIKSLISKTNLTIRNIENYIDLVPNKLGELVERNFSVYTLSK